LQGKSNYLTDRLSITWCSTN